MRARSVKLSAVILLMIAVLFGSVIHAAALDDTYRFDDLKLSIKFPKSDYVITRDTPRGDAAFTAVDLDYDETMTAFRAANIYLRAYDPDNVYQISMTVVKDDNTAAINNYSDLTAAERKAIVDSMLSDASVSSAVEVKHNGSIFFDSLRQTAVDGKTVYISQSNTIINSMQIDLIMQKYDEPITAEEAKALTAAVNSLSFDEIRRNTGPVFDWWRLLLWALILAALSIAVSFIYKQYNAANKRKLEEHRRRRIVTENEEIVPTEPAHAEARQLTFEEALGYKDDEEFTTRAAADEMAETDISVKGSDPAKGISYFEDEGTSIDDGTDYFDTYFKEPTERRTPIQRLLTAIGSSLKIAFTHTGYFFKNIFKSIFGKTKNKK